MKTIKLSKKQRGVIYFNASQRFGKSTSEYACNAVEWELNHKYGLSNKEIETLFPELFYFKTAECTAWLSYQINQMFKYRITTTEENQIKKTVLLFCYEMTK